MTHRILMTALIASCLSTNAIGSDNTAVASSAVTQNVSPQNGPLAAALQEAERFTEAIFSFSPVEEKQLKALLGFLFNGYPSDVAAIEDQVQLFDRLKKIRDGDAVSGIKNTSKVTYYVLIKFLKHITSPKDNLDERAGINLANAILGYARTIPANNTHLHLAQGIMMQEAYYIYTILAAKESGAVRGVAERNANEMLKHYIKVRTPTTPATELTESSREEVREYAQDYSEKKMGLMTDIFMSELEASIDDFSTLFAERLSRRSGGDIEPGLLATFTAMFSSIMRKSMPAVRTVVNSANAASTEKQATDFTANIMGDNDVLTRGLVEQINAKGQKVPDITLQDMHCRALFCLLSCIHEKVLATLFLRGKVPVVVPLGRSVALLYELHEMVEPKLRTGIEMRPILASGLSEHIPTPEQKDGYRTYLKTLNFDDLADADREVILLDVSESGRSLQTMQDLLEELFPGLRGNVQSISILYDGNTSSVPRTRVIKMEEFLGDILFAKHTELAKYCLYPTFYTDEWTNGQPNAEFAPDTRAIKWRAHIKAWTETEEAEALIALRGRT